MNATEQIDALAVKVKELKTEGGKIVRDAIKELSQKIFDTSEKVKRIEWRQYAPSFNDGDACIFSVKDPTLALDDDEDIGAWNLTSTYRVERWDGVLTSDQRGELAEALLDLAKRICSDEWEPLLKSALGDSVRVTIDRELNVEIEDYYDD